MSSPPLGVALVEDDHAARARIRRELERTSGVAVAGEFGTGEEALARLLDGGLHADVAIVDLVLPGTSGLEVIRRLHVERPRLETLVLTTVEDSDAVLAALEAGASGYIVKSDGLAALREGLAALLAGGSPMSPAIARRVIDHLRGARSGSAPAPSAADPLTAREREVLGQLARGATYTTIARALDIGIGTVQSHVKAIYRKLGVHSRAEAAREAFRRRR